MSTAGRVKIEVWKGGYPVWCRLNVDGKEIASFHHNELSDLRYAVEKAMQEAVAQLRPDKAHEVLLP
jgi:hypothetical protein